MMRRASAGQTFRRRMLWSGCLAVLLPTAAVAGVVFPDAREHFVISSQNTYRVWTIEDNETGETRTVRQAASRLSSTFEIQEDLDLVLYTSGGASQDRAADTAQLGGLADVKLKGFLHAWRRQLLLSVGVNLPTGRTALSEEEIRVAQAISPTVLGFRMREYGRGLDADFGAALGRSLTPTATVGVGANVLVRGKYDLDEVTEYAPGSEVAVTAGIDWRSPRSVLTFDLVYRAFGTDQQNGQDSYDDGNQLELTGVYLLRRPRWGLDLAVKNIVKAESELIVSPSPPTDTRVENGLNWWFTVVPRYQPSSIVELVGMVDLVAIDQSQMQATSAWALDLGLGCDVRLTSVAILEARLARLTGGSENDVLDLSGWDTGLTFRWQY